MDSSKTPYEELKETHIMKPYDTVADIYAQAHFDEPIFDPLIGKFASMLPQNALILDAGCGPGGETKKLLSLGLRVTGIDVSGGMLAIARKRVPDGIFRKEDLTELSFDNDTFDGIWSARALIHIPETMLELTLSGFRRVLKPEGITCITVLTGTEEGIFPEEYDQNKSTEVYLRRFPQNNLEDHLQACGFTVLSKTISYREPDHEPHLTVFARK